MGWSAVPAGRRPTESGRGRSSVPRTAAQFPSVGRASAKRERLAEGVIRTPPHFEDFMPVRPNEEGRIRGPSRCLSLWPSPQRPSRRAGALRRAYFRGNRVFEAGGRLVMRQTGECRTEHIEGDRHQRGPQKVTPQRSLRAVSRRTCSRRSRPPARRKVSGLPFATVNPARKPAHPSRFSAPEAYEGPHGDMTEMANRHATNRHATNQTAGATVPAHHLVMKHQRDFPGR